MMTLYLFLLMVFLQNLSQLASINYDLVIKNSKDSPDNSNSNPNPNPSDT
ncbi:hypothetical protein Lalb_Chr01g0000211 [Lupinus albus]|uniref:Uncharacterized protein n=1 Tax=Lupinus albus TaxID=3870 RepID=A0A6A4R208_LUPAL|nr:hypothetical protein Lalb_Chr01g0000211 [Lupinus albus]